MEELKLLPVWSKLTDWEKNKITESAIYRKFPKGDIIHTSGDCMGLIYVTSGRIRAYTVSEDGREITLYRLLDGDICLFSASCVMKSLQFDVNIMAERETESIVIPSEIYKIIMESSAPLAMYTNEIMASRFSDVMWLVDAVMWKSLDSRLADFLISESSLEDSDVLKITHETIGNHIGSPREVVTRVLKYLSSEGAVKLSRGTVEIIDRNKLFSIARRHN